MTYDPERDPGRSHEGIPSAEPPAEDQTGVLGAVASVLAWPVLVAEGLIAPQPSTTTQTGGGVSLLDTIARVTALQRAVRDQMRLVNDFLRSNRETIDLVSTQLAGSTKGYDQQMIAALNQTETSLRSSLASLEQAATALDRVRAI